MHMLASSNVNDIEGAMVAFEMRDSGVCELLRKGCTVVDYLSHAQMWMLMEGPKRLGWRSISR
jgi:hypothetical protein